MMRFLLGARVSLLGVLLGLPLVGCEPLGDETVVQIEAVGIVGGVLFKDLNGNGQPGTGDEGVEGWQVRLEQPAGGVIATAVTDTAGEFVFEGVPAGRVAFKLNEALLGDTLELFGVAFDPVTLASEGTTVLQPGVSYPKVGVTGARAYALGKPIFTTGVALNAVNQSVTTLHVMDMEDSTVIRVLDLIGRQVAVGDSVRVRGRTARVAGQPALQLGEVFILGAAGSLVEPLEVGTGTADGADSGDLDGAFVQVREAEIIGVDDLDENGVRIVVDDGSGELEILFRPFLGVNPNNIDPETQILTRARGVLVPRSEGGETRWTLQPRVGPDYRFDPKPIPLAPVP